MGYPLDRQADVSLDNFPICPDKIPKECRNCPGEIHYPSCNIRIKMFPELENRMRFRQKCTPLGGGGGD